MTTQLASSHCRFTELHSAPNDGKDSNRPNRLALLCEEGKAPRVLKSYQKYFHSWCLRWSGGRKTSHTCFPSKHEPHTSQRRNPGSSSCLEAGTWVLSQAEQKKKETGAKPLTLLAWTGETGICFVAPWKAGGEMKSPVSWYNPYKVMSLMSCSHKHSWKEKRVRVTLCDSIVFCFSFFLSFLGWAVILPETTSH